MILLNDNKNLSRFDNFMVGFSRMTSFSDRDLTIAFSHYITVKRF